MINQKQKGDNNNNLKTQNPENKQKQWASNKTQQISNFIRKTSKNVQKSQVQNNLVLCFSSKQLRYCSKLLLLYSANYGIYVMPQSGAIDIWHGVVFVRYGIYKDAKFKFKILFQNFPDHAPKVYFINKIFHPCVDWESGLLDLGNDMQNGWSYGTKHLIFSVVDVKCYENTQSYNKNAGELFLSTPDEYFYKVRECVQNSKNQLYTNYPDTSFKFIPLTNKYEKIKNNLKLICGEQGLNLQQRKKKFIQSLQQNT